MRLIILRRISIAGGNTTSDHEREQRVLQDHDADEPDQREQIAADRIDEQIEHLRRRGRAGHEPRGEFRRVAIGEKADALVEQLAEQAALVLAR